MLGVGTGRVSLDICWRKNYLQIKFDFCSSDNCFYQLYDNSKYPTKSREKATSLKIGPEDCKKHDQMIFKVVIVVNKPTVGDGLSKPLSFQVKLKVRKPIMVELTSHCT